MRSLVVSLVIIAALLVASLAVTACSNGTGSPSADGSTPGSSGSSGGTAESGAGTNGAGQAIDARTLIAERCASCHDLSRVKKAQHDEAGWRSTVQRMRGKGARVDEAEQAAIAAFLASGGGSGL